MMKRREFITLLGGAAAAWPLAVRAQQGERMRRIGMLIPQAADDPESQARVTAFALGLQESGWIVGRNVQIEYRWGAGDADRIRRYAAELAALAPDVIVTTGGSTVPPLLQATRTVPIVFVNVADPVGGGLVDSLSRPGGNATGFVQFEYSLSGKWLELLKQVAPGVTRAAVIRDPTLIAGIGTFAVIQAVAPSLVTGGGLISYGPDLTDQFRKAAGYVDLIFKGETPAELPVQTPTRYELAINLKTAKALGLDIPATVLARADEVIE
jgi:putative ABC transport system substrate-binding protein